MVTLTFNVIRFEHVPEMNSNRKASRDEHESLTAMALEKLQQ